MSRVSENSSSAAVNFAISRAKSKLEDLQLKGSTMKSMNRPSDNPVSNIESLTIKSATADNKQYMRNSNFAQLNLSATEHALENITDILVKTKEIGIAQASDLYNSDVRKNISNEVVQLRNELLVISNKRIGNKYIFGGYATTKPPFDKDGNYRGDSGQMALEISKDFFIPINLNGSEIFFSDDDSSAKMAHPLEKFQQMERTPKYDVGKEPKQLEDEKEESLQKIDHSIQEKQTQKRDLASNAEHQNSFKPRDNIFSQLNTFIVALESNDPKLIQDLLEKFDNSISRLITLRTRVGSLMNSLESAKSGIDQENIDFATRQSQISDADVAELFSDIQKQQQILKTTYQAGKASLNRTLMDFVL